MACGNTNGNICPKKNYCEYGAYCVRVHNKIREELKKTSTVSAIDVEKFLASGGGRNCKKTEN